MNKLLFMLVMFFLASGTGHGEDASSSIQIWKLYKYSDKGYKLSCQELWAKGKHCDAIDVEGSIRREMWFHFPNGINICERMAALDKDGEYNTEMVYCVGMPDKVTKEVIISECPLYWPDDPSFILSYGHPLNPYSSWYLDTRRDFTEYGQSPIFDLYFLGKYKVDLDSPIIFGRENPEETYKDWGFYKKDIVNMVCMYTNMEMFIKNGHKYQY